MKFYKSSTVVRSWRSYFEKTKRAYELKGVFLSYSTVFVHTSDDILAMLVLSHFSELIVLEVASRRWECEVAMGSSCDNKTITFQMLCYSMVQWVQFVLVWRCNVQKSRLLIFISLLFPIIFVMVAFFLRLVLKCMWIFSTSAVNICQRVFAKHETHIAYKIHAHRYV